MRSSTGRQKPSGDPTHGADSQAEGEGQHRTLWLTSPVLIAFLSAAFGLLGTGLGALLQGYWNAELERQKFEANLILDALEPKEEAERARRLDFLVRVGLLRSLNAGEISLLAQKPDQLPRYHSEAEGLRGLGELIQKYVGVLPAEEDIGTLRLRDIPPHVWPAFRSDLQEVLEKTRGSSLEPGFLEMHRDSTIEEVWVLATSPSNSGHK